MRIFATRRTVEPLAESTMVRNTDTSFLDVYESTMVPTMEGYVGKTKNLQRIEELFAILKKKYPSEGVFDQSRKTFEDSHEKTEIESLLCKEFGFRSACVAISSLRFLQAVSAPKSVLQRDLTTGMPRGVVAHGDKYYDVGHQYDFFMAMTNRDLIELSPGELTAMVLHEVGHCFDVCMMTYIGDVFHWITCISLGPFSIFGKLFNTPIVKYSIKFIGELERLTPVTILANAGLKLAELIVMLAGPLSSVRIIDDIVSGLIRNPLAYVSKVIFGFGGERFADSFATAYGYGAETISLRDKMDTRTISRDNGLIVDTWTWSGSVAPTIMAMLIDPHPEAQTRARMALDDLEHLANNKALPAKLRESAKKDHKKAKEAYELFCQVEPEQRNSIALRFSRQFKENWLSGKCDLRSYFFTCSAIQDGIRQHNR